MFRAKAVVGTGYWCAFRRTEGADFAHFTDFTDIAFELGDVFHTLLIAVG